MRSQIAGLFLVFLGLSVCVPAAMGSESDPATFSSTVIPSDIRAGEVATIVVRAQIDDGWHIYGLIPTPPPGPSPTSLSVSGKGLELVGTVTEDAPITAYDPNFGKNVSYHKTSAIFYVPVKITASPGLLPASLTVHYQTCNNTICLPPTTKTFPMQLDIFPGSVREQYASATIRSSSGGNIGLFLLAAIGAGLLALITPCVFPLIPITLTTFVKQADGDKGKLVRISLGYSFGIVLLYVAVGALTAILVGAGGVDKLAANPFVNLFAFFVFVIFAFSFFETVQISLPVNLGELQNVAKKQSGLVSLVLLGVVFVFASFTCTAPFIGTLLVTAAGGSLAKPLLGMLVFAAAFVSPFVFFSFFPAWISRIPKGGVWLARVKATLGFIELAASLKFLSNVDLYWQLKILTEPVMLALWALVFAFAAFYLFGVVQFGVAAETQQTGDKVSVARLLSGAMLLLITIYCLYGLSGRPISPVLATFLPPSGYGAAGLDTMDGLSWLSDYQAALSEARAQSKPLLIDFTGYTCTNCRLNEKQVFPDPAVQSEFAKFVRVQLYTDSGPGSNDNEKLQLTKFGDVALPLYGILDPSTGAVVAKTAGVQTAAGFTAFLKSGESMPETTQAAWAPYTDAAVAAASSSGKPAIIDFTAQWCTNCKAIERTVFPSPAVAQALQPFITLRCDMTDYYSPANLALQKKYSIVSLPAIVFISKRGVEVPNTRVSGLISSSDFAQRLSRAIEF